jgi:hypothetical protein
MNADLVDREGERIGFLADLAFDPATGTIVHYLVSRSDPRLPGSSRWQLVPDRITDQRPGQVMTALRSLDDLPLMRASVRQDLLQRTQRWREQLRDMGDRAGDRLEGWLDEPPWDEPEPEQRSIPMSRMKRLRLMKFGMTTLGPSRRFSVESIAMKIPGCDARSATLGKGVFGPWCLPLRMTSPLP